MELPEVDYVVPALELVHPDSEDVQLLEVVDVLQDPDLVGVKRQNLELL